MADRGQRKFAQRMAAELRRQGVAGEIELDEQQFALTMGSGQVLMLGNAYAEWQRAPRLRRGRVLRQRRSSSCRRRRSRWRRRVRT